jgi:hypothetical protein
VFGDEGAQPVTVLAEDRNRIGPRVHAFVEREVVQAAEQLKRAIPPCVVQDLPHRRLSREPPAKVGVERGARALALLRLVQEDPFEPVGQLSSSAALACSAILPNASGSATATSASTFRSSSMPAFRQPATNWL